MIPSLNGIRAISILLVIIGHLDLLFFNKSIQHSIFYIFAQSDLGVNTFFVLSGFLITSLLIREENVQHRISTKKFYQRRALRILPAYLVYLATLFVLQECGVLHFKTISWVTSLTYTKDFKWNSDWETAHFWSLSIEEQFYLIWPWIFLLGKKARTLFAWAILLLIPALRFVFYFYPLADNLSLFYRADSLMTGALLAIYQPVLQYRLKGLLSKNLFGIGLFLFIYLATLFPDLNYQHHLRMGILAIPFAGSWGTFVNMATAALILFSFTKRNYWYALLNTPIMNYIGKLSYSVYIWQQLFLSRNMDRFFPNLFTRVILIMATAIFSYHFIESWFLKWKERYVNR